MYIMDIAKNIGKEHKNRKIIKWFFSNTSKQVFRVQRVFSKFTRVKTKLRTTTTRRNVWTIQMLPYVEQIMGEKKY